MLWTWAMGQLAWTLRCDKRVVNMERTNIRHVTAEQLQEPVAFFSVDVSFISLKHIFPVAAAITAPEAEGVCLVKPQFEAGKEKVGKKGVVREAATHREVIEAASRLCRSEWFFCRWPGFFTHQGTGGEHRISDACAQMRTA